MNCFASNFMFFLKSNERVTITEPQGEKNVQIKNIEG